jgi:hypothetical protein
MRVSLLRYEGGGEIVFNVPLYEPRTLPNHL